MCLCVRVKGDRSPPGSPWPLPGEWRNSSTVRTVDPRSFSISSTLSCDVIDAAISRYKRLIFLDAAATPDGQLSVLKNLAVKVSGGCEKYPGLECDESCEFYINKMCTIDRYREIVAYNYGNGLLIRDSCWLMYIYRVGIT